MPPGRTQIKPVPFERTRRALFEPDLESRAAARASAAAHRRAASGAIVDAPSSGASTIGADDATVVVFSYAFSIVSTTLCAAFSSVRSSFGVPRAAISLSSRVSASRNAWRSSSATDAGIAAKAASRHAA